MGPGPPPTLVRGEAAARTEVAPGPGPKLTEVAQSSASNGPFLGVL